VSKQPESHALVFPLRDPHDVSALILTLKANKISACVRWLRPDGLAEAVLERGRLVRLTRAGQELSEVNLNQFWPQEATLTPHTPKSHASPLKRLQAALTRAKRRLEKERSSAALYYLQGIYEYAAWEWDEKLGRGENPRPEAKPLPLVRPPWVFERPAEVPTAAQLVPADLSAVPPLTEHD